MKKILLSISLLGATYFNAQLNTPNAAVGATTNPTTGNVGIGTNSPLSRLSVAGDIAYGDDFTNTLTRNDAGAMGVGVKSGFYQTSNPINFPANASNWWHLLDVRHSNAGNNFAMQIAGSFFDQEMWFRKTNNVASQPWRKIVAEQPNGNVGIGTNSPQAKLDVDFGGEPKTIKFLQPVGNSVGTMVSMMRFTWYNDTADFGMVRSGSTPIEALAVRFNQNETARFTPNGNVGIGTTNPQYSLDVNGSISTNRYLFVQGADIRLGMQDGRYQGTQTQQRALVHYDSDVLWVNFLGDFEGGTLIGNGVKISNNGDSSFQGKIESKEVRVTLTPTADFVFAQDYALPKLEDVEKFVTENKHLPEVASAEEMKKEGVNIGEFQIKLLQKIEELTLYSIEQNKMIKELQAEIKSLKKQ